MDSTAAGAGASGSTGGGVFALKSGVFAEAALVGLAQVGISELRVETRWNGEPCPKRIAGVKYYAPQKKFKKREGEK